MSLFYDDLAAWWPLLSPLDDYAEESEEILRLFLERHPAAGDLLDLGSGGGHVAFHLKHRLRCVLSDLSPSMLAASARINPECRHVVGDMRTLDLGETFDLVLAHDAVDYLTTEADVRETVDTAWRHLRPGGLVMLLPDDVAEHYEPGTDVSGGDAPDGRAARLFEWSEPPAPDGTTATHYSFLLREADGAVRHAYERHVCGLFSRATWEAALAARGFAVEVVTETTDEDRPPRLIFIGRRP